MALIDKLTDLTSFDYNKVGKTNTTDASRFEVNQKDNSGRVESLDDLPRPNIERNPLPPVVKGVFTIETALDVSTSTKGILFKAKSPSYILKNAKSNETRVYDPTIRKKSRKK